jgi:hypothetical protein
MYMLCEPGKSSTKSPAIATLSPRCVKLITPRTVLPFFGSRRATAIGPASGKSLTLDISLQPAHSATTGASKAQARERWRKQPIAAAAGDRICSGRIGRTEPIRIS